jgi:hypothetical protein
MNTIDVFTVSMEPPGGGDFGRAKQLNEDEKACKTEITSKDEIDVSLTKEKPCDTTGHL